MSKAGLSLIGSRCVTYHVDCPLDLAHQKRFWAMAEEATHWDGVLEAVPGITSITLSLADVPKDLSLLEERLNRLWEIGQSKGLTGNVLEVDVIYGGKGGPHLHEVAEMTKLSVEEVVHRHSSATYTVYALGSHAGYCYLGGLDPALQTPRRKIPLQNLPGGSLSVAGLQTGISASAGPSGWNTIGSATIQFFDPAKNPPALLAPGDQIRINVREVIE